MTHVVCWLVGFLMGVRVATTLMPREVGLAEAIAGLALFGVLVAAAWRWSSK